MKVCVISATQNPLDVLCASAGTCYQNDNVTTDTLRRMWANGHESVFEHVSITWKVDGISRVCSHQLVRHRLASYTQQSLRYTEADDYALPPSLANDPEVNNFMRHAFRMYVSLLRRGTRPEDARYVLPMATSSQIYITMNLRELMHFYALRTCAGAQSEIRELADLMVSTAMESPEIAQILNVMPPKRLECKRCGECAHFDRWWLRNDYSASERN